MSALLIAASGTAEAQVVYLINNDPDCDYKVRIYFATGDCHEGNNFWVCTGTQSSVLLTVGAGSNVTYSLPPNTGACKYEVYDGSFTLVAACNTSSTPYYCEALCFTNCVDRERCADMNSGCENDVNAGTVKIY